MAELMMTSMFFTTMLLMFLPLFTKKLKTKIQLTIKAAFTTSLITTIMMMKLQKQTMTATLFTPMTGTMNTHLTLMLNKNSMLFLPTALLVTWSIMQFSSWYMKNESKNKFMKFLLIFLISMTILATSGSLMQLIIGWEGVGIMSFMLINWWSERANANTSAMQAIIYNRIGDIGLILTMIMFMTNLGTWDTTSILTLQTSNTLITLGLILAATGKSAQFLMHMWLPAAMEGPTPVSSLLHSSTMVIAGIYMLAQMHPIMNTEWTSTMCILLGSSTSTYAALCATAQNDIKKIIAFSTSSQLGLMMIAIGINKPNLAMFHMMTHATFKSTLFLCSGSIIHNMKNEQDIRKTNCTNTSLPITTTLMLINGLALAGIPFLSGFYSKDLIIEALTTTTNAWALMATLITTTMTSMYTVRMIFLMTKKYFNGSPTMNQNEKLEEQITPLIKLTMMAIMIGTIMSPTIINQPETLNPLMKLTPMLALITGTTLTMMITSKQNTKKTHWKFINQVAFFGLLHRTNSKNTLLFSNKISTQLTDLIWLENISAVSIDKANTIMTNMISIQKGQMKNYITILILTLMLMQLM